MFELIDMLIVRPIANILFVIYGFVGDFGLAIILFTVLVKILLWPLAKRQLDQTRLMRKIQPELAEIKKNCNGNRQLESLQMLDLYKRNNIKPFRSILTLIIQLPIFIALYTAVRVMVLPTIDDNLEHRAYAPVRQIERIHEVIELQKPYLSYQSAVKDVRAAGGSEEEINQRVSEIATVSYDFHPKLFGIVDLDVKPGFTSTSAIIMLLIAMLSALSQYWISRQQLPSKKTAKSRTFRQIMKEAAGGKEPDQTELNQVMTNQMSFMMPLMMFLVMINLPGALVFYYGISNLISGIQQKIIFNVKEDQMEAMADKKILKDLKRIEEGEVVAPSKPKFKSPASKDSQSGLKITHISIKDRKKHKK